MSKLSILVAGAAGYVLGARAGRERYEQIVSLAQRAWRDPRVQEQASAAAETVKQKAPDVASTLADVAKSTAAKMTGNNGTSGEPTRDDKGRFTGS